MNKDEFEKLTRVDNGSSDRITKYFPDVKETKAGDIVSGTYTDTITFKKGTSDEATYYKLKSENDVIGVRGTAVIKRAFEQIKPGTKVAIRYEGKTGKNKQGRPYHAFDIRLIGDTAVDIDESNDSPVDLSDIPF